ncbi:hypothetical protein [Streptomyces sp. NRRL B-24484]|uniref:hypothetical protein n=1 Tax=Streptomyces sp. NRRL B-24484 TaxID=1463833 RepID=UPI0004C29CDB|nr:hypothetical protein [Streptomyces sp. NRRL B-24484]
MTRHADRKQAARDLADTFGIRYTQALTALERHTPPTDEDFADAEQQMRSWDPLTYTAMTTGTIPAELMGGWGEPRGDYALAVPDPVTAGPAPAGPDGVLGMVCRPVPFGDSGQAALAIEAVAIREGAERRVPGLWWAALDILLHEQGWHYDPDTYLPDWRIDLYPVTERPSALARVHVHNPTTRTTLFDAPVALPPIWLTAARLHPLGVQVVAGPLSGTLMPVDYTDDAYLDHLFGTGAAGAARIPLHITPVEPGPDTPPLPAERATDEDGRVATP